MIERAHKYGLFLFGKIFRLLYNEYIGRYWIEGG